MTISTPNRTVVRSSVVLGCLCAALLAVFGCGGAAKSAAEEASAQAPAAGGSPSTADNGASEAGSMIAFASDRDGDFDIYLMNADGSGLQQLTRNDADDFEPTWSPDGQQLAFTSTRAEFAEDVYVMNADGSGQQKLTPQPGRDYEPAWSPDGQRIAFTSSRDGVRKIYVMNADGTGQRRLTGDLGLGGYGGRPAWSPDGQRITFQADGKSEGNDGGIYVINADGSEQHRLTEIPHVWHCGPVLSPDGQRIAFGGVVGGTSAYLYVGNPDGSRPKQLAQFTSSPDACMDASWSPDGRAIAYWSELDGLPDIQVIGIDGTGLRRLTRDPASDVDAAWQPAPSRG